MVTSARRIRNLGALLLGAALIVGLGGCEGDDGDDGATGPAGPPGPSGPAGPGAVSSAAPAALTATITGVTIASPPVVDFTLADQDGFPFIVSDTAGEVDSFATFTIAKLVPGEDGDTNTWENYILSDDVAGGGVFLVGDRDRNGTMVSNGNGSYTYTFATDVTAVPEVPFEADRPHRVALQIGGSFRGESLPAENAFFDFRPDGQPITETRDIVSTETCNNCHGQLRVHGSRLDVEYCVTCHYADRVAADGTSFAIDEETGNSIDFRVLIHKLHRGENLPSVVGPDGELGTADDGVYQIGGFRGLDDFSDVAFPQDVRNCTTCHDPANPQTPDAVNFLEQPNTAACESCHDDVDVSEGAAGDHQIGAFPDDTECATCHGPGRFVAVDTVHTIGTQVAAGQFQFNILDVSGTGPGETPVVVFSVTDPTNADAPYDILTDPRFNSGGASTLNIDIALPTSDYTNFPDGAAAVLGDPPSGPLQIAVANGGGGVVAADAATFGANAFQVTSPVAIPATETGSLAVAIEGHPAEDLDGDGTFSDRIPVTGVVEFFGITDAPAVPRRDIVELAKCQTCHGENDGLALHGANRTDNIQLCVLCHNPNNTDIAVRPTDPDATVNGANTAAADGLEERTIDFKYMIHGIHGSEARGDPLVIYGFRNSVHDFSGVRYPREPSDCLACHAEGTYELPVADGVLGTTVATGATVNTSSPFGTTDFVELFTVAGGDAIDSAADPTDDAKVSATAAVCSSCHTDATAQAHMEDNGGLFGTVDDIVAAAVPADVASSQAVLDTRVESCAVCHGPGALADVAEVHGVE